MKIEVVYEPSPNPAQYGTWSVELDRCAEGCHALVIPGHEHEHSVWHEMLRSRLGED